MTDFQLSMGLEARDDASPAIQAVQKSLEELRKVAVAIGATFRTALGDDLKAAMASATVASTRWRTELVDGASKVAAALQADVQAVDALAASFRQASAAQRRFNQGRGRGGGGRPPAPVNAGPDLREIRRRWDLRERSARAEVAQTANVAKGEAARQRALFDGVARQWKLKQASQRDEMRHLTAIRRERAGMQREFKRRVSEFGHHGHHAVRSINHPSFESVGFWVTAGAAFGLESGKHLLEAAKNIDTVTTRYRMMPGVSEADAAKVRADALREGMKIGMDPAEVVKLNLQGLRDGLSSDIAKSLPSIVNSAVQFMGGNVEKDGDELAKAVRESVTVGWVKDAAGARSLMNQVSGLSTFAGNSPEKMQQALASGVIGRGKELGWSQQQTLAMTAALNGAGERTGFGSARLLAQVNEIRAGMRDRYTKASRSHENTEERRAILSAPKLLGYSGIGEMQNAMASPEGLVDLFSRMQGIDEKKRAQIEKGYGFGPQFNAVEAEMGADGGKRYHAALAREKELSGQNADNDDLNKNSKIWSGSIEFMLNQLKASASAVQSELGDVVKEDILQPFTGWWVEVSNALLDGGMKQDLHRAIRNFITGLGFADLTAALNGLRSSVGTFDLAGFLGGVGEGLRVVVDQLRSVAKLFGMAGDGDARGWGKFAAELLGASIALRIAAPAFTLLSGVASAVLAIKAAFGGVAVAAELTGVAGGVKALVGLDLAGGAAGLMGLVGSVTALIGLAGLAQSKGILKAPGSLDGRGILRFLDPGLADRVYGPEAPASPSAPTSPSPSAPSGDVPAFSPMSYQGGVKDNWRDLLTRASYEPSNAAQGARDAQISTARGVFEIRDAVDHLARQIRGTTLAGADAVGAGAGGGSGGAGLSNMRYGRTSSGAYRSSPGGAGAGGGNGMTAVSKDLTPESRALLDTLASGEAPDYNVMNGGGRFSDYSHHPGGRAAGRYQFLPSTWRRVSTALGLKDFSPESQDKGAWWLAQQDYKSRTGRNLQEDLKSKDPSRIAAVGRALHSTWVSLNGSFGGKYQHYMDRQSSGAVAGGGTGGASARGQVKGMLKIGSETYRYGSGGAGGSASVPFGDYPINPDAPGAWGRAHNAMAVNGTGSIWDKSLGRMRTGIEMHAASTAAMVTHGCLGFLKEEYPKLKARVREMIAKTGHAYLHVGPNGASITPYKGATPADVARKVQERRSPPATAPASNTSADNSTVTNHFHISHPDGRHIADRVVKHFGGNGNGQYSDVRVAIA